MELAAHGGELGRLGCPAAGARGRGHAAPPARRRCPGLRLLCLVLPLQALPGGAGCAAAGSLRPDNGARCGGGGSTAGAARLLSGALPMAEAVPCLRTVVRVGGGRANQKVARLTSLHEYYWCLHCPLS